MKQDASKHWENNDTKGVFLLRVSTNSRISSYHHKTLNFMLRDWQTQKLLRWITLKLFLFYSIFLSIKHGNEYCSCNSCRI